MKKCFCLFLIGVALIMNFCSACAESISLPLQSFYTLKPISQLKAQLLVPSSLDLREVNMVHLTIEEAEYQFIVIHYVAQNKMGGHSDDIAYALTEYFTTDAEVALQIEDEPIGDNPQMNSLLSKVIFDYLFNMSEYTEHFVEIPVDWISSMI